MSLSWLQSLLEEHFDELQMLGELRRGAWGDPDYTPMDLRELDQRIEAHVDGLILGIEQSLPMLESGLAEEEWSPVFAASLVLLRTNDSHLLGNVMALFRQAESESLAAIRDALCLVSWSHIATPVLAAFEQGDSPVAVAAAEVAAHHGRLNPQASRLTDLLSDPEPAVREAAWRVVAWVDSGSSPSGRAGHVRGAGGCI